MSGCAGRAMSRTYRLNSVGERTDPRGAPFVWRLVVDGLSSYKVYTCLSVR